MIASWPTHSRILPENHASAGSVQDTLQDLKRGCETFSPYGIA
jgi:hypothetical protein